jgi:hypothetical protein
MRLYLDDNITDRRVVAQLHRTGHVVLLPVTVGHSGVSDAKHLAYAIREGYVLLTKIIKTSWICTTLSSSLVGIIQGFSFFTRSMTQPGI